MFVDVASSSARTAASARPASSLGASTIQLREVRRRVLDGVARRSSLRAPKSVRSGPTVPCACGAADRCGSPRTPARWNATSPSRRRLRRRASSGVRSRARRASGRSRPAVCTTTTKPMCACWTPQNSAHSPDVACPASSAVKPQHVVLAGDRCRSCRRAAGTQKLWITLSESRWISTGRPAREVDLVGGRDRRARIAHLPPPALADDVDPAARPARACAARSWCLHGDDGEHHEDDDRHDHAADQMIHVLSVSRDGSLAAAVGRARSPRRR